MTTLANQLQKALDAARIRCDVPGATVAVYLDGQRRFLGASGSSDLGGTHPLATDAIFPSYSITKTMTAVAALRLAERGDLDLDASLAHWLPALPWSRSVTLRQLLGHTAGIPNYSVIPSQLRALEDDPLRAWSFPQFLEATCYQGLRFPPGAGWEYSNTGYMLLRHVLERCSGHSFGELTDAHVVRPLGLQSTAVLETPESFAALTPGFSERFGCTGQPRDVRGRYDPGWCATGVLASSADEISQLFEALFAGALLAADSLRQMLTLTPVPDAPGTVGAGYGLGIMGESRAPSGPEYGHGGGGPGYDLRGSHFPALGAHRASVTALCNRDRPNASWKIVRALRDTLLEAAEGD